MDVSPTNSRPLYDPRSSLDMEQHRDMESIADPRPFFKAVLEVINPLQHIPVISNIYRYLTGDTIHPITRIIGDALYGGPAGLAGGVINAVVENISGKDIGGNLLAAVFGPSSEDTPKPNLPMVTENVTAKAIPTPAAVAVKEAPKRPVPVSGIDQPAMPQVIAAPRVPVEISRGEGQFLPFGGGRIYSVPPRTDVPHPSLIRSKDAARSSGQFPGPPAPLDPGRANVAYGKALELSRQIRDHYQPTPPVQLTSPNE